MDKVFENLFIKPCVIGLVANVSEGKSNLIYYLIKELLANGNKNIVSYGLRVHVGERVINSLKELEECKDEVIFLDEMMTLFDLDNRMEKRQIENTLRLIAHNNNILILCGLPENFKKFVCGKISSWIFKKVTLDDLINGSTAKKIIVAYRGIERGTEVLSLGKNECIVYTNHYYKVTIPYVEECDTKKNNLTIVTFKKGDILEKGMAKCQELSNEKNVGEKV